MEINGLMPADISCVTTKRNKSHDGKTTFADIEIGVEQGSAEKRFGTEFAKLAFSTLEVREDETGAKSFSFLQDTIKPNDRLVLVRHRIEIDDEAINEQPELLSIKTCDGSPRVIAEIRIPIPTTHRLAAKIQKRVNETIDVKFTVEQPKLGFEVVDGGGDKKKGKSHDAEGKEGVG